MIVLDVGQHMVHVQSGIQRHMFQIWYSEPEQKYPAEACKNCASET